MIPANRHMQAIRAAAAMANRRLNHAAGTHGNNSVAGYVTGIGVAWKTIVSLQVFIGPTASDLLVWAYVNFNRTSGTIGDTFFAEIVKDSDPDNSQLAFPSDASFQSLSVPNDTLNRGMTLIAKYMALPGGIHTFYVRGSATGDTFQAIATVDLVHIYAVTQP